MTRSSAPTLVDVKYPTRIITYCWGERYVDVLLTFTLTALLAPNNLPYIASQVPCELVILTQRRYFSRVESHPVVARIREFCPVRLMRLDDLIVSQDKYGMTLTYALHRAFSDLGPAMTERWQIFLNADFILADGSLRAVIDHLARGERLVAAPSYCTVAEEVIPELRKWLDPVTSALRLSHRELARLILRHRHTVIRGKTVNQAVFHMRYADQFYWSVDDTTLLGYQMPVSIVGMRPERDVPEPNTYWDYGLIREYCPSAEVCVIGDSDEFTMLELRDKRVAQDQVIAGPPDKKAIAARMVTWVTPYQKHFLNFALTLHEGDVTPGVENARNKLWAFVDQVMSNCSELPSHIEHSQWDFHYDAFHRGRRLSSRIQSRIRQQVHTAATNFIQSTVDNAVRPALRQFGLEILKSSNFSDMQKRLQELSAKTSDLGHIVTEYQFKLERSYDYQLAMAQDQIRLGMSNLEPEFLALYEQCRDYTMTSWERLYAVYKSIYYIVENKIPGAVVECGVWRGGSMKLAAHVLCALGETDRTVFLYDTYEGMTEPDPAIDVDAAGNSAASDWAEIQRRGVKWSAASIEEVREVMATSGYPSDKMVFVKGPVERTIPGTLPDRISLLRLDTDWYASTLHEMEHLYPRLSAHGVLLLDDYGHYQGARRAVDEYFQNAGSCPLLCRVDYSCRIATKCPA